jgi:invasion protein IalB
VAMTRKQRAKQSPQKKVRQKWQVNPKQLKEVKTECFLYQNSIADKQKQQRIHDLEKIIEELTLQ